MTDARKGDIRGSSAWKALVAERDSAKPLACYETVERQLCGHDVEVLVDVCAHGDDGERQRALSVLAALARAGDARLGQEPRRVWIRELARAAETDYPRTLLGRTAFSHLSVADPTLAEEILLRCVNVRELNDAQREEVARACGRFVSAGAVTRLRQLARLGGPGARHARFVLEGRGLGSMKAVEALARRWRRTRSPDALHALYLRYVTNQVGKVRMGAVVKLLGRPDRRDRTCVWYSPNRDTALFMEADEKGMLRAVKFT